MKKRLISLFFILSAVFALFFAFPSNAATISENGLYYEVSKDETYVTIIGYVDQMPSIKIDSEIEGLPVKEIAESAFQNCQTLHSVIIPDSVEIIGEAAFRNCKKLTKVVLPSNITFLPFECFRDCEDLTEIKLPESLKTIDDHCFYGCSFLGKLKIPASVDSIGYDAFMNCENIRLDVSENTYAADYAEKFNVNTDFKMTLGFFIIVAVCICIAGVAISIPLIIFSSRYFAKHPNRNPFIYIGRGLSFVFSKIGNFFVFIKNIFVKGLDFVIDKLDEMKNNRMKK